MGSKEEGNSKPSYKSRKRERERNKRKNYHPGESDKEAGAPTGQEPVRESSASGSTSFTCLSIRQVDDYKEENGGLKFVR